MLSFAKTRSNRNIKKSSGRRSGLSENDEPNAGSSFEQFEPQIPETDELQVVNVKSFASGRNKELMA